MRPAPIRHRKAAEPPFVQLVLEQVRVFTGIRAAQLVVRTHDGHDLGFLDGSFESRKVDLV